MKIVCQILLYFIFCSNSWSQISDSIISFSKDTISLRKQKTVFFSQVAVASVSLVGLHQLWYKNYPKSKFHFINDNAEWLQMDKVGHFYSAYQLSNLNSSIYKWSGASPQKQLLYGAGIGFAFLTAVEVMDGFSAEWGASTGDIVANFSGAGLFVSQQLLWKEQRIVPKFSFHTTKYAQQRPDVLGKSPLEQILKDYNGQTYWLSANLYLFAKTSKIPKWLNIAVGYGANSMLYGDKKSEKTSIFTTDNRFRQYYFSLDVDLSKIKTKSTFWNSFFLLINTLKVPAPTLEYGAGKGIKAHFFYL